MNILIFDNELSSVNLIKTFVADFHHVTLMTTNSKSTNLPSPSSFLSIQSGDIVNASQVLQILSRQENDPFDAILIFDLPLSSGLTNISEAIHRLKSVTPPIFLFYINRTFESDKTIDKTLKDSTSFLHWTIITSSQINESKETKFRIEKMAKTNQRDPVSSAALVEFLNNELKSKEHKHKMIHLS